MQSPISSGILMLSLARLCVATRSRVLALADSDYFWNTPTVWTRSELSKPRANGSDKGKLHAGRPGNNDTEKTLCKSSEQIQKHDLVDMVHDTVSGCLSVIPGGIRLHETANYM